jgi:pSer/pThr/pTyr-binding forkhead associated (FHA) protein
VDPAKTIGIDLWAGQVRGGPNMQTSYGGISMQMRRDVQPWSMRQLFLGAYVRFADMCREVDEPGLALLAIDEYTGVPAGLVRLRARVGRHVAAIVGRHDQCDLFLDRHASLALRHLAVVLDPVSTWARNQATVKYRVLDLRTESGFTDEGGKHMRGLRADGPAIMRVAGHAVFVLPLGDQTDWPQRADEAWDMLPERVYFDEMSCRPEGSLTNMPLDAHTRRSLVYRTHGPRDTGVGLVQKSLLSSDVAGTLEIIGETRTGALKVGDRALRDGVLIGRYARCDGATLLEDPSLSRVHALLLQIDDALMVIDTASRNGTYLPAAPPARVITITGGTEVNLGKHTRIRWRWAH